MIKTYLMSLAILSLGFSAQAKSGDWIKQGGTAEGCPFAAEFFRAKGLPFAKLEVSDASGAFTIPLALSEAVACEKEVYQTAYPRSLKVPTYSVVLTDLCAGSLPKQTVTVFYSGVKKSCGME